ncbi:MAG TPA: DinB family protein [Anaerolineae bacterium]|nr:DinB family protein [Anaerolineae bacterium]HOR00523.1 DinB family protein [Anaerolineae bacterium]HPL27523.1 DinB family protein [Anaerolineae bacterium]
MPTPRVETLTGKLEKGGAKTLEILGALAPEQWTRTVYAGPPCWDVRALLAHLYSAEVALLALCREVALGGMGAPPGYDYDAFNAEEQERLKERTPQELLAALAEGRRATIAWARTLSDSALDRVGRHPALGEVTLETMATAMYGHQLLHMRDLQGVMREA